MVKIAKFKAVKKVVPIKKNKTIKIQKNKSNTIDYNNIICHFY